VGPAPRQRVFLHSSSHQEFLAQKSVVLKHPASSPDLASWDFFGFPSMMNHLKGLYFETAEDDFVSASTLKITLELMYSGRRELL
jgi:hypothetical protein